MTMRDLFKKVEGYNEMAALMNADKAAISFAQIDNGFSFGSNRYNNYAEFRKWVKRDYLPEVAQKILNAKDCEFDSGFEFEWRGGVAKFTVALVQEWRF